MSGPAQAQTDPRFWRGVTEFNAGKHFQAHETWELLWRSWSGPEREFLQGLIQVAAALHHLTRGNLVGYRAVMARARSKLAPFMPHYAEIDVASLIAEVDALTSRTSAVREGPALAAQVQVRRASTYSG